MGAGALRPLGLPRPVVEVEAGGTGQPLAVRIGRRWLAAQVVDRWRIDDEWWRGKPVSRAYFSVGLEDGRRWTVFRDLVMGKWFRQSQG